MWGTVDLSPLPATMKSLIIAGNAFSGDFEFGKLPADLYTIRIHGNRLTGTIVASELPRSLFEIMVDGPGFEGSFDFSQLPPTTQYLCLNKNQFYGTLRTTDLPRGRGSQTFLATTPKMDTVGS